MIVRVRLNPLQILGIKNPGGHLYLRPRATQSRASATPARLYGKASDSWSSANWRTRPSFEWLRAAAKEGFDAADRRDFVALHSEQDMDSFFDRIREEVLPKSLLSGSVAKKQIVQFHITGPARRDLTAILKRSLQEFGAVAALLHGALIRRALLDLEAVQETVGLYARPEIMVEGARTYHLAMSRNRVTGVKVKEPRHFLLYRRRQDGVAEVARILHDSQDLDRHRPEL